MTTASEAEPPEAPAAIVKAATSLSTYRVQDFIDSVRMKQDLALSTADLSGAMQIQASLFAYYGTIGAQASHQVDVVKMLLESTEATIYQKTRDEFAAKAEKVTEVQLEKIVSRHSSVISMKQALNHAKRVEAQTKIAVEAFRHKRDMLVQLGATSREELKGEMVMSQRNIQEEANDYKTQRAIGLLRQSQ